MLSVFRDFVRHERLDAAGAKLGEGPPRLPYRVDGGLRGLLSRGRTLAARRIDPDQDLGHVAPYAAEFPGLSQRLPEASKLVDQPEFQCLRPGPYPSAGDAVEGYGVYTAATRDAVLELGVNALDLAFDHTPLLVVGTAARIEKAGMHSPI